MKTQKFDLEKIEKIEEIDGKLVGGYSEVLGGQTGVWDTLASIVFGGGDGICYKPTTNPSCTVNAVAGCGSEKKQQENNPTKTPA